MHALVAVNAASVHDAFAAMALLVALASIVLLIARFVPTTASFQLLHAAHRVQLPAAAALASVTTLGSLWFSEWAEWVPCRFCWFQRIFMYSSAVVLLVAAFRRDRSVRWYVVPLAGIGILLSTWHILIEHRIVEESAACSSLTSCATPYAVSFGRLEFNSTTGEFISSGFPVTLAVMAFCAFAAIMVLLLVPESLDDVTDTVGDDVTP